MRVSKTQLPLPHAPLLPIFSRLPKNGLESVALHIFQLLALPLYSVIFLVKKVALLIPGVKNYTAAKRINIIAKNIFETPNAKLLKLLASFGLVRPTGSTAKETIASYNGFLERIEILLESIKTYTFCDEEKKSLSFWNRSAREIAENDQLLLELLKTCYNYCLVAPCDPQELSECASLSEKAKKVKSGEDKDGIEVLQFNSLGLTCFPDEFVGFPKAKVLDLSNNQIARLPEGFSGFSDLEKLDLRGNCFKSLPSQIEKLKELQELDVSNNQIASLPEMFSETSHLKKLNLSGNSFKTFPTQIGALKELQELDMSNNQIATLPKEFCGLSLSQDKGLSVYKATQ